MFSLYKLHRSLNDIHSCVRVYRRLIGVCFIQMTPREVSKEELTDRKGVIRSPKLKWDRQYNDQK